MTEETRGGVERQTFSELVFLLADYLNESERVGIVNLAFFGLPLLNQLEFDGGNLQFATHVVSKAIAYGEDASGQPVLFALMDVIHANVGRNKQAKLAKLKQDIQRQLYGAPLITQSASVLPFNTTDMPLTAEAGYFRVWLRAFHLAGNVEWFTRYYPLVYSTVTALPQQSAETPLSATRMIPLSADSIGQVVAANFPLTGITAYHGGDVSLMLHMSAIEDGQCSSAVLSLLANTQRLLDAPTNRNLLDAQTRSINTALGASAAKPYLMLNHRLASATQPFYAGDLAIIGGTTALNAAQLQASPSGLRYNGSPLQDRDYFLLHIEHIPEREGWQFGTLGDLLDAIDRAFNSENTEQADVLIEALKYALYESAEYTLEDKKHIALKLKQTIDYLRASLNQDSTPAESETLNALLKRPMSFFAGLPTPPAIRKAEDLLTYF